MLEPNFRRVVKIRNLAKKFAESPPMSLSCENASLSPKRRGCFRRASVENTRKKSLRKQKKGARLSNIPRTSSNVKIRLRKKFWRNALTSAWRMASLPAKKQKWLGKRAARAPAAAAAKKNAKLIAKPIRMNASLFRKSM